MIKRMLEDIDSIRERDPAARSRLEVFLLYSGFHAVVYHRIANWLYRRRLLFLARWVSQTSRFLTGVEIHPAAKIGRGFFIDHGSGVVIGETSEIGDYVTLYQNVTLGGTGKDQGKRHPTVGDYAMIGSGARVLGPVRIGCRAKVAAGAVVLDDVPDDATAVGVPARIVRVAGKKVESRPLDQIHIPDPVSQELCRLEAEIDRLRIKLEELETKKESPGAGTQDSGPEQTGKS
jgi:serine O-acetyltransferase